MQIIPKGYNRNLIGGTRRLKGVSTLIKYGISLRDLSQRVIFESKRLTDYHKRVSQYKSRNN